MEQVVAQRLAAYLQPRSDQVTIRSRVDPAIIGGVVARIGDQVIDDSVRGRLERLRAITRGTALDFARYVMAAPTEEINSILVEQIKNFSSAVETREVGSVVQVGDGIARVYGLGNVGALELVEFTKQDVMGIALNLEEESVGVMVLGPVHRHRGRRRGPPHRPHPSVPVGPALIGRVVNPLGEPLDGKGPLPDDMAPRPVELIAPGVVLR